VLNGRGVEKRHFTKLTIDNECYKNLLSERGAVEKVEKLGGFTPWGGGGLEKDLTLKEKQQQLRLAKGNRTGRGGGSF